MTQAVLKGGQQSGLIVGFHIDHPVRREAGLFQGRGEQIRPGDAPEHRTPGARSDARGEKGSDRPIHGAVSAAGHLMERAQRQAAGGQPTVEVFHAERQNTARRAPAGLNAGDLGAQGMKGGRGDGMIS